jgi:hypothetical protein
VGHLEELLVEDVRRPGQVRGQAQWLVQPGQFWEEVRPNSNEVGDDFKQEVQMAGTQVVEQEIGVLGWAGAE